MSSVRVWPAILYLVEAFRISWLVTYRLTKPLHNLAEMWLVASKVARQSRRNVRQNPLKMLGSLSGSQFVVPCERAPEAGTGCADENDYCVTYEGMNWYFSGDKQLAPVFEKLSLQGRTRSPAEPT